MTLIYVYAASLIILIILLQYKFHLEDLLNPVSFYLLYYSVFVASGGLVAYKYTGRIVINDHIFYLVFTGLISCVIGSYFVNSMFKRKVSVITYQIYSNWTEKRTNRISVLIYAIGITLALVYYIWIGTIPILHENADVFRVAVKEGKSWLYILAYSFTLCGIIIFSLLNIFLRKRVVFSFVLTCIGFIVFLGMGFRGPALQLLLIWYIIFSYLTYGKIKRFHLVIIAIILMCILAMSGWLRTSGEFGIDLEGIILISEWRIFVQFSNLQIIYDWINNQNGFLLGKSYWIDLATLFPGYQPSFSVWLKERIGMDFAGGYTTTLVGEMYANFGMVGVVIISFLMGTIMSLVYNILIEDNFKISLKNFGLLLLLSVGFSSMVTSGIFSAVTAVVVPFCGLYVVIVKLLIERKSII